MARKWRCLLIMMGLCLASQVSLLRIYTDDCTQGFDTMKDMVWFARLWGIIAWRGVYGTARLYMCLLHIALYQMMFPFFLTQHLKLLQIVSHIQGLPASSS